MRSTLVDTPRHLKPVAPVAQQRQYIVCGSHKIAGQNKIAAIRNSERVVKNQCDYVARLARYINAGDACRPRDSHDALIGG
jgi:hypothetical protein